MHDKEMLIPDYLDPLHDVVFTKIFEDKESSGDALLSLINAVRHNAGEAPLSTILEQTTQRTFAAVDGMRGARMDVVAVTADQHVIDIEVQLGQQKGMTDRSLLYGGKIFASKAEKGLAIDDMLDILPHVMMINLLDFRIRPGHGDFHQPIRLYYEKTPVTPATDRFSIHHLDLVRFREIDFDIQNPLHRWLKTFLEGYKNPAFMKEVSEMDTGLVQFAQRYNMTATDEHTREEYFRYNMAVREQKLKIAEGKAEGKAEGIVEGKVEGKVEMLYSVCRCGVAAPKVEEIAREHGISTELARNIFKEVYAEKEHGKGKGKGM